MNYWTQLWDSFAKVLPMSTFILLGVSESGVYQNGILKRAQSENDWRGDLRIVPQPAVPPSRIWGYCASVRRATSFGFWSHGHQVTSTISATKQNRRDEPRSTSTLQGGCWRQVARHSYIATRLGLIAVGNELGVPASKLGHTAEPSVDPSDPSDPYLLVDVCWCMLILDLVGGIKYGPLSIPMLPTLDNMPEMNHGAFAAWSRGFGWSWTYF